MLSEMFGSKKYASGWGCMHGMYWEAWGSMVSVQFTSPQLGCTRAELERFIDVAVKGLCGGFMFDQLT